MAYLAEQDGLASNDGTYISQVAAAYKELQDQEASSQASYETDIGNDEAAMNNDIDSQYGTEQTSLRGFEDTRQKAYAVAEQSGEAQMAAAYNNEWRADIAAEQEQGENDSAAYAAYGVAILGPWQTEMNAIMTATVAQVATDSAAKTANSDAIAAAKGQEVLDEEAASIAADSATATALQTYFSQVASAWLTAVSEVTEDDPDSISVAQACLAYYQSLLTDATAAQSQIDAAEQPILQDEVANWEDFIGEASSADEALANAVAAATATQVSQDAASVVSADSQDVAETQNLADEEIAAAATEAGKEVAAYIADSAAWAVAEGGRAIGYISAATTWILSIIPTAVSDQESLNSDAASANGQIASDIADFATKLDAAQQQEVDDLVGPAKTEIHDVAVARNTLVVAQVTQQASDADTAAQSSAATIAAEPDGDFSNEEQGGGGWTFIGLPSQPETPMMGEALAPYTAPRPTKAEQIALDNSWSCQKGLSDAQAILGASSPELTAIIGAAWNAANNLSITTTFFKYPVGSGRPHCADYAGTIQAAIRGVQQNKFSVQNVAFTQLGNHEIMVKDKASGKEIAIYVDPACWAGYNSGLDGAIFGPTFYVVDGQLERELEVELQEAFDQAADAEAARWEWLEKNGLPPPITD